MNTPTFVGSVRETSLDSTSHIPTTCSCSDGVGVTPKGFPVAVEQGHHTQRPCVASSAHTYGPMAWLGEMGVLRPIGCSALL